MLRFSLMYSFYEQARSYANDKLMPRIVDANRHEKFDKNIMLEMGELGL